MTAQTQSAAPVVPKKERSVRFSEAFYSIEGEGPLTGMPTVFLRLFGCNFTCSGFNNPDKKDIIPIHIDKLDDFQPIGGCDSIYSWHPAYKDLSKRLTITELAQACIDTLPDKKVINERSGNRPILSITGGEPTLHQKAIIELLHHPLMRDFDKLLIETNAAVELKEDFLEGLESWLDGDERRYLFWSNSPKLAVSGEAFEKAIRPEVIEAQGSITEAVQYLKFVSDGSDESFEEILDVLDTYNRDRDQVDWASVYVMPMGASLNEQEDTQLKVALKCMEYGFNFCARVHVNVFKNAVGT